MKRILTLLCGLLVAAGTAYGQKPFFFVQLTDTQLGFYNADKDFIREEEQVRQLVGAINRLRPSFLVITGDLVNDKDDEGQLAAFGELCRLIDPKIPLYLTPGNHDVGNEASEREVQRYIGRYGYDRFSFRRNRCRVIGINTTVIKAGTPERERAEFRWLEQQLRQSMRDRHRIVVGHHPFFVGTPDEEDAYDNIPQRLRFRYLELLDRYDVELVLAGHLHRCAEGRYRNTVFSTAGAAGRPLGPDKPGMQIVVVRPDGIEAAYYEIERIPEKIDLRRR